VRYTTLFTASGTLSAKVKHWISPVTVKARFAALE